MALLNPVYAFIVPFLFLFTVPLAIFAGITTTVAFTVLLFRVVLVYLDLALTLLPSYLNLRRLPHQRMGHQALPAAKTPATLSNSSSRSVSPVLTTTSRTLSFTRTPHRRPRSRRPSMSHGATTPDAPPTTLSLLPSTGLDRDFEGIGGWRLGSSTDDDRWTMINSRLELPDRQRHHHRSPSGGGADGGFLMMKGSRGRNRSGSPEISTVGTAGNRASPASPNSSRVRTPGAPAALTTIEDGEYFPRTRKLAVA
ncbi:conserved hypothetical protein [Verticillium alfalfae VaMs.102]|uniref:Uncharacterized protein n=1 Tax=Verticillium alfalfae (strain VaMs.102 / ATCC MYA-4576 / FGSC 10136) TaxID=526221 RepID=C9S680_VERA1|nr:conserved hypothetical protein [Verticillium alfalfae VaMs.102]EEY15142.1 conserved hypothetical protein [Verticillium alfalfae VaMs.102]